jgi:hypothetical protein
MTASAVTKKKHKEFKRPSCKHCGHAISSNTRYKRDYRPELCGMCAREAK